jgi:hypothetical protein
MEKIPLPGRIIEFGNIADGGEKKEMEYSPGDGF